jgi:uncharacterized membrane protein YphA (DoxX/SURF4 family)
MTQVAAIMAPVVLLGRLFFALIFVMAGPEHLSSQTIAYAASHGVKYVPGSFIYVQKRRYASSSNLNNRR